MPRPWGSGRLTQQMTVPVFRDVSGSARVLARAVCFAVVAAGAGGSTPAQASLSLAGSRLIEEGFSCAGWRFEMDGSAVRYDEVACARGGWPTLTARAHGLSAAQFMLVETVEANSLPDRPPRVWLFKIESVSGERVQLRETWLGWGARTDALTTYRRIK